MSATLPQCLERGDTVVTATRRLARHCRELHDRAQLQRGRAGWRPADALTWDAWVERVWRDLRDYGRLAGDERLLSQAQERVLWEQVLAAAGRELMMTGQAATEAMEAHRLLLQWRVDEREVEGRAGPDTRAFLELRRDLVGRCREEDWILSAELAGRLAAEPLAGALRGRIALAGFDDLAPDQQALLEALAAAGIEVDRVEASPARPSRASGVPCQDRDAEVMAAAAWARDRLEADPGARVGLVLADLEDRSQALCHALEDLIAPALALPAGGDAARPWNLSLGPPLADWPAVDAALLALGLWLGPGDYAALGRLLRSPWLAGGASEAAPRARLDAWLRGRGVYELDLGRLPRLLEIATRDTWNPPPDCPGLVRRLASLPAPPGEELRLRSGEWAARFTASLAILGWPGERPLDSAGYQCVRKWQSLLDVFSGLEPVAGAMTARGALERLRRLAADTPFQPEGEPAPVQVLGLLETAGLEFDALWVGGLEDQAWPRPMRHNALLPAALQRAAGMPRACPSRELEFARRTTARLAASAPAVVMSWPAMEGEETLRASPMIAGLPGAAEAPAGGVPRAAPWAEAIRAAARIETVDDYRLPAGAGRVRGGAAVLRSQSACPFQGQARWRLRADPLETPVEGVNPMQRGAIAHRALEMLWREWGARARAAGQDPGQREREVAAAVRRAVAAELPRDTAVQRALAEVETEQVRRHVLALVDADLARPEFTVEALERRHELELEGLGLRLRVDRVDLLEDGGRLVIDYKTGRARPADWLGDRPAEPQLPLYALAAGSGVRGVAFGRLAPGETGYLGLADGDRAGPGIAPAGPGNTGGIGDWAALLAAWRGRLTGLARDFVAGVARVDPRRIREDCARCHLRGLCRRDELEAWGVIGDE